LTSTYIETIKPPLPTSTKEVYKVKPPTSSLEAPIPSSSNDMRALSHCCSTTMAPPLSPTINAASSSSSINLEAHSPSKINYFANLLSDIDESDDKFDPYTIPYPSNFVVNESLPHSRFLTHIDSSIKILKERISEFEKIINIYQTNMNELE
jgi:hypothetical protein